MILLGLMAYEEALNEDCSSCWMMWEALEAAFEYDGENLVRLSNALWWKLLVCYAMWVIKRVCTVLTR